MSFCSEAWDAIARYIYTGLQGGSIMKGWMKEMINITEYAQMITEALPKGILLNTKDAKFNSMVIGWGVLGTVWGQPIPSIAKVCGMQSGRILTLQFRNGELQGLFFTEIYNHLSTN